MRYLFVLVRYLLIILLLACIVAVGGAFYYMQYDLPDVDALNTVQLQVPLQIYTSDKKLIATFGEKRRIPLPYEQIPQQLIQAVLATEDQHYFEHKGVDLAGLGRAAITLALTGKKLEGGSTITMQVARSFYLTRNKTYGRKLREILLAIKIEHKLTKQKILDLYLNKIFLGNRAYGVEAAAEIYYGKHLNQLSLDQYAMLAGLPKAPSTLNPITNPVAAKNRRDHVLTRMHDLGYIDDASYQQAMAAPINASYHDLETEVDAPYVAELVRQQLEQMYGDSIYTDNIKVYTTIQSKLQKEANAAVQQNVLEYDKRHGYRGPEANWGTPDITATDSLIAKLQQMQVVNNLEPAVVMEMTDQTVTVLRANGDLATIPWAGLSWARHQLNADYLGAYPTHASQIVKLGDVVRIIDNNGQFSLAQLPKAEGALVTLNPHNGAIVAMTGGFSYLTSKFNRVTSAMQQPGSSFKPFVYSAAFNKGYTLATVIDDKPFIIENPVDGSIWRPQNDTRRFYGPTRLRTAIIESRNVVSIRLLDQIGLSYALSYVQRFGFAKSQLPPGLSLALGTALVTPLQMAQAYAVFANGGFHVIPYVIDSVYNSQDVLVYRAKPLIACGDNCPADTVSAPRVISAQNAYLITSALHDVIENAHGTASAAQKLGRDDLAGKTGTTQDQVSAWFAGYNPDIVTVVWMGFDQPQSLHEFANKAALPMWMLFMQNALKNVPQDPFIPPDGIVTVRINPLTGERTADTDPNGIQEYFMTPYLPPGASDLPPPDTSAMTATQPPPMSPSAQTSTPAPMPAQPSDLLPPVIDGTGT